MKKNFFIYILFFLFFRAFCETGDVKYVSVPNASIKEKPSVFSSKIAKTEYGEKLIIEKDDSKKWILVRNSDNKIGWIPLTALSDKKFFKLPKANFSKKELAFAGKGFSEEKETDYKKNDNVNYEAVDNMEKKSITNEELKEFLMTGNLNVE